MQKNTFHLICEITDEDKNKNLHDYVVNRWRATLLSSDHTRNILKDNAKNRIEKQLSGKGHENHLSANTLLDVLSINGRIIKLTAFCYA